MNEPRIFENPAFGTIRAVTIDGEPWLVGKDVAAALGYKNTKDALIRHIDPEDKRGSRFPTTSGEQEMTIINESGVYSLVLSSKLPDAKKFKRWVTSDVLPTIRKTGAYMTPDTLEAALLNPDTLIRLAQNLKEEQARRMALEKQAEADRPKVIFANAVAVSGDVMLIREFSKQLRQNGVDMGEKRLFADLRARGFLIQAKGREYHKLTQKAVEMGLFKTREIAITHSDGAISTRTTPLLTGKGRQYFMKLYLNGDAR